MAKAVKVTTTQIRGGSFVDDTHTGGTGITVQNGHLVVTEGGTRAVAIYAPETWRKAEVVDSQ